MSETSGPSDLPGRYDKILKENQDEALPGIIKNILGIEIVKKEILTSKLQHTKEREVDRLALVTDRSGQTYILNIEWQSQNDPNMLARMLEYRVMAWQKHKLPVKQYVLYMGSEKLSMKDTLCEEDLHYWYHIINLSEIDYKVFLKASRPEEKVLAVLGNFGADPAEEVIAQVLKAVTAETSSDLSKNRYFNQLQILVQIRNLVDQFEAAMESVKTFFKVERDPLYKWGVREERAKAEQEKIAIARSLKKEGIPVETIAKTTGLSIDIVLGL